MSRQTMEPDATARKRAVALLVPSYLIATFLWDALTAAHELPMRAEQVMSIVVDLLAIAGLVALRAEMPKALFRIALCAGLAHVPAKACPRT